MNFSSLILKIVNIYLIVFLYRQYKKREEKKVIKEEEEVKDVDTWYPINDEQSRYKGEWKDLFWGAVAAILMLAPAMFVYVWKTGGVS